MDINKEIEIAREQMINFEKYQRFRSKLKFKTVDESMENVEVVNRLGLRIAHLSKRIYDLSYAKMRVAIDERMEELAKMRDDIPEKVSEEVLNEMFGESNRRPLIIDEVGLIADPSLYRQKTMGDWTDPDNRTNNQIQDDEVQGKVY